MDSLRKMTEFLRPKYDEEIYDRHDIICKVPQVEMQCDTYMLDHYPKINLKHDIFNSSSHKIACIDTSSRNLLIPVSETVLKRITRTFFENGTRAALDEARNQQTVDQLPFISKTANFIVHFLDYFENLKTRFFPHAKLKIENIAASVETRDWLNSSVRYIAWHPLYFKLAVAGADDIIRVYTDTPNMNSVVKCTLQKQITCMAWRPLSTGEIAVGCEKGVYIWTIDNNMQITRSTQNQLIKHPNNVPVTSLQWNKIGTQLVMASIGDRSIIIWEVDRMLSTTMKRFGPPISLLKWSPGDTWLFTATKGNIFRIWDCWNEWEAERWRINTGTIQSAAWSPCEKFLVFVSTSEPILYRLRFAISSIFVSGTDNKDVLPIVDLSPCTLGHTHVGGMPQQLAWDPNGKFLVITFKNSSTVAIFRTHIQKFDLQISPGFYLSGKTSLDYPSFVTFQSVHRKNKKTVLTIGWSSGHVQFAPLS